MWFWCWCSLVLIMSRLVNKAFITTRQTTFTRNTSWQQSVFFFAFRNNGSQFDASLHLHLPHRNYLLYRMHPYVLFRVPQEALSKDSCLSTCRASFFPPGFVSSYFSLGSETPSAAWRPPRRFFHVKHWISLSFRRNQVYLLLGNLSLGNT